MCKRGGPPCERFTRSRLSSKSRTSSCARFDHLAELIDQGRALSRGLALPGRILQATDGQLRGQRRTALGTTADRDLHQRIVAKPVETFASLWTRPRKVAARLGCSLQLDVGDSASTGMTARQEADIRYL